VILGGGTAGLTLARRLAEDARYTVAVVNAGDFAAFANGNWSQIPAFAAMFGGSNPVLKNPLLDWGQYTSRQSQLDDRIIFYPSGKVLGGGSARNYMWFPRAPEGALKKWADLTGDESYLFDNMLPFYKKAATFTTPSTVTRFSNSTPIFDASLYDEEGGPVQATYPNWANPISSWLEKGFKGLGLSLLPGALADGKIFGYAWPASSMDAKTQSRSSAETSYLREVLKETTNLNLYKNTMAKKIMFDGDKKAIGALVESDGVEYPLYATKEVIVSAGFVRSPQLLMASGVGPANTLEKLGIDVVADLPGVGQNMWDHALVSPTYQVDLLTHSGFSDPAVIVEQTINYRQSKTGMLTNNGGDILAFSKLPEGSISSSTVADINAFSEDWPHIQFMPLDAYLGWNNNSLDAPVGNYISPMVALTAPFSRGNITITSDNTNDHPILSPNWLLDPRDQEMVVAAFKRARQLLTQEETKKVIVGDETFPGLDVASDEDILALAQKQIFPSHHGSCTCKMGKESDSMAVLDSQARVYGLKNLRVVDASSFPVLPPGAPCYTVYAFAEKIAADILSGDEKVKPRFATTQIQDLY
jgi:choline dehydrogenase